MIKPARLMRGDRVAIVAPSGPVHKEHLEEGISFYRRSGFEVVLGKHISDTWGYLAGKDEHRAQDLNEAFADRSVKAIICARGGYGASRVLPLIDYDLVAQNPKIFQGFSDITGYHQAIAKRTGLITFLGPGCEMPVDETPEWNKQHTLAALTSAEPIGEIKNPPDGPQVLTIVPGVSTATIVGGNLSLIASTIGTPYEIEPRGCILLLEDVTERPYRLDRMLAQLKLAGKFVGLAGVVIGECAGCEPDPRRPSLTLPELFDDYFGRLGVPVFYGLACGHGKYKATIPLGTRATIDATRGVLVIEETATV